MHRKARLYTLQVALLIAILAAWELLTGGFHARLQIMSPLFFSRPSLIWLNFVEYAGSGLLFEDIGITLIEALAGLILGLASGVIFGIALARFPIAHDILDPYLVALNSLPRPALAPLLIVWFGLGISSKIFLAWSLVFFIVFYNTVHGIKNIDPERRAWHGD